MVEVLRKNPLQIELKRSTKADQDSSSIQSLSHQETELTKKFTLKERIVKWNTQRNIKKVRDAINLKVSLIQGPNFHRNIRF